MLFRLVLGGDLGRATDAPSGHGQLPGSSTLVVRAAIACLIAGVVFLSLANAAWAHAVGAAALLVFAVLAARALISAEVLDSET